MEQVVVGGHPVVLDELSWSPVESIHIVLGVVIVKLVIVYADATWHAANDGQALVLKGLGHLLVKI